MELLISGLIIAPDREVLLVPSKDGYDFPLGEMQKGESIGMALKRIVKQKTGFEIENVRFHQIDETSSEMSYITMHFIADFSPHQEKRGFWVSGENALKLAITSSMRAAIEKFLYHEKSKIFFRQLPVFCTIGILPHEQIKPQQLFISVEIERFKFPHHLDESIDYREIADLVIKKASSKSFLLIEDLARDLIETIQYIFEGIHYRVVVEKPSALKGAKYAAVELTRSFK